MNRIKYTKCKFSRRPTFSTAKYGNLLADSISGEVEQGNDGLWSGWFYNHSDDSKTDFRLGFKSRRAAIRWVNKQLRTWGV